MKTLFDKAVLVLAAAIIFYLTIILLSDYSAVIEQDHYIEFQYFPIILSLMVFHTLISAIKFHRLLQKLEIRLFFLESLKIFLAGLSLGVTPGGLGIAIKSRILKKKHRKSISSTVPIILIERWTELIAILVVMTILLAWSDLYESRIVLAIGYAFVVILAILATNYSTFESTKKLFMKIKYLNNFIVSIDESRDSLSILTKKINFLEATLFSIVAKSVHLITVYLVFLSVGVDIGFFQSGQIYYTSLLAGTLSFIPAGIVVTETSMIAMLLRYSVDFSIATLAVIIMRFFSTWMLTIVGAITLKFVFRENKTQHLV